MQMDNTVDAVVEVFAWVGLGVGALVAGVALVLYLFDGTWHPKRVVIDDGDGGGRVARWFDDAGGVGQAYLTHDQAHALAGRDEADVFVKRDQLRLTRGSPVVRATSRIALGLLALGLVALVTSWVLLFVRG
jgi:hypothetical protein